MVRDESRPRRIFACLGDPSRFRLLTELASAPRCVSDLARAVGLSQSCTTRHIQTLQREGLVDGVRHGKKVVCRLRLEDAMVSRLVGLLVGDPESVEPATSVRGSDVVAAAETVVTGEDHGSHRVDPGMRPHPVTRRPPIEDFLL